MTYYNSDYKIAIKISNDIPSNSFLIEEYEYSDNITIVQVLKFDSPIEFDNNKTNQSQNGVWIKTQNFKNNKLIYEVMNTYNGSKHIGFKEITYSENGEIISQCVFNKE